MRIGLKRPFKHDEGHAYRVRLPEFASFAGNMAHAQTSGLALLEDGKPRVPGPERWGPQK